MTYICIISRDQEQHLIKRELTILANNKIIKKITNSEWGLKSPSGQNSEPAENSRNHPFANEIWQI